MSMSAPDWETLKPIFDKKTLWLLIPGSKEAYVPLFEGTLREAIAEALVHATYWETTTTVFHAPEGRYHSEKPLVAYAKASPVSGSPLRP